MPTVLFKDISLIYDGDRIDIHNIGIFMQDLIEGDFTIDTIDYEGGYISFKDKEQN